MATKRIEKLVIGDRIMPPPRELQLWMRRTAAERGLPETALQLTVVDVQEASLDKKGRWIVVTCDQTPEWLNGNKAYPFRFKARPETSWQLA